MCVGLSNHSHNTNLKRGPVCSSANVHHWTLLVLTSHVVVTKHCELMFVCLCHRWVPVKVRTVPHLRRPWQRRLKDTRRMEEVPATSFPWRQPLPRELFVSCVIKLLCSPPHPLNRTDLPRAPWTKPEYSCLEKDLHPVGITHCTRKLSMWLEAPPPFSWFLVFLHWGSEMINLLILRKWELFWGYLVLTLSGAFGLDWELRKHFFVRESVFMPFLNCSILLYSSFQRLRIKDGFCFQFCCKVFECMFKEEPDSEWTDLTHFCHLVCF